MNNNLDIVKSLELKKQELLVQRTVIDRNIASIDDTLSLYKPQNKNSLQEDIFYDKSATWKDKVLYAIESLGEAYVSEIINLLQNKEHIPKLDAEKIAKRVTITASTLYNKEHLLEIVEKDGRANKYKLKNPS